VKSKLIGCLILFLAIFLIYKLTRSEEATIHGNFSTHDTTRAPRVPRDENHRIKLKEPTTALERKRILHFANNGVESFEGFSDSTLDPELKAYLTDLVHAGEFQSALHFLSDLGPEPNSEFFYTLCFQWALIDRDASLAAISSSDFPADAKHAALMAIFQAVANDPDPDTLQWLEKMLANTATIPGLDVRLGQIAAGWVTTGVMGASDFVSLWEGLASQSEAPISNSSIFSALASVARASFFANGIAVETSDEFPNEHMKISDREIFSLSTDLIAQLDSLPIPDINGPEAMGPVLLASYLGQIEGRLNGPASSLDSLRRPADPALHQEYFRGVGEGLGRYPTAEVMEMLSENKPEHALVWEGYINDILLRKGHADILHNLASSSTGLIPEALQVQAARQIGSNMIDRDPLQASKQIATLPGGAIRSEMVNSLIAYLHQAGRKDEAEAWEKMR